MSARARRRLPRPARARPRRRTPSAGPSSPARAGRGRSGASDPRMRSGAPRRRSAASRPPPPRAAPVSPVAAAPSRARPRSRSPGVTAIERICGNGVRETIWIESTAPSDETHMRGRIRSEAAWRAYSIDEIGARSSCPSSSIRVQLGRDALHLLHLGVQPVEDRRHVHVRDAAEPHHRRSSL